MPTIHLTTFIEAPVERVFDLSRSIDFHVQSMEASGEVAIAGVTSGLIGLDETVTWQARHFFKTRKLSSTISGFTPFTFFEDTMVEGDFKSIRHEHHFKQVANGSIMIDLFNFETPYGAVGRLANTLFLTKYLVRLLCRRNEMIKHYAETDLWKQFIPELAHA